MIAAARIIKCSADCNEQYKQIIESITMVTLKRNDDKKNAQNLIITLLRLVIQIYCVYRWRKTT